MQAKESEKELNSVSEQSPKQKTPSPIKRRRLFASPKTLGYGLDGKKARKRFPISGSVLERMIGDNSAAMRVTNLLATPITECASDPVSGEISIRHFRDWQRNIMACRATAPECDQQLLFNWAWGKAGAKLRDIWQYSSVDGPPPLQVASNGEKIFDMMMERLSAFFEAGCSKEHNQTKFALLDQGEDEKSKDFIMRLNKEAEYCDFVNSDEHVVMQIAGHARLAKLREKARERYPIMSPHEKLIFLSRKADDYDLIEEAENARIDKMTGGPKNVFSLSNGSRPAFDRSLKSRNTLRRSGNNASVRGMGTPLTSACDKCGLFSHRYNVCPAVGRQCKLCSVQGHFARCCPTGSEGRQIAFSDKTKSLEVAKPDAKLTDMVKSS